MQYCCASWGTWLLHPAACQQRPWRQVALMYISSWGSYIWKLPDQRLYVSKAGAAALYNILDFYFIYNPYWVFRTCTGIKLAFTPFPDFGLKERWTWANIMISVITSQADKLDTSWQGSSLLLTQILSTYANLSEAVTHALLSMVKNAGMYCIMVACTFILGHFY